MFVLATKAASLEGRTFLLRRSVCERIQLKGVDLSRTRRRRRQALTLSADLIRLHTQKSAAAERKTGSQNGIVPNECVNQSKPPNRTHGVGAEMHARKSFALTRS